MRAGGVALMGLLRAFVFIHLSALVEAAAHATDGTLTWDRSGGQRTVFASIARIAQAGAIAAVTVVRAIIQACLVIAVVPRPSRRAVASVIAAFAMARALQAFWRTRAAT